MRGVTRLPAALTLAALLCLGTSGCGPREKVDLAARVLFTANGSYDAQADVRDRLGKGVRRVAWTTRPPLPARAVTVRFDSNARPAAWEMRVEAPEFRAADLAGEGARTVQTPDGEGLRPAAGRLEDVLILSTPTGLRLLNRGWAAEQEPGLYSAFGR